MRKEGVEQEREGRAGGGTGGEGGRGGQFTNDMYGVHPGVHTHHS